jgi:hypothetical protein
LAVLDHRRPGKCFRVGENRNSPPPGMARQACNQNNNWDNVLDSYPHVHGSPVTWSRAREQVNLYVWPEEDFLQVYRFNGQEFSPNSIASSVPTTAAKESMPGGFLSLSWDGVNPRTAIIWASRPNPNTGCDYPHDNYPDNLAPDNAPCNASNKIVPGYLEAFVAVPDPTMLVLGTDGNLWLEHATFGNVPPARQQVDGNVQAFQGLDSQTVLVLGTDRNLWLEHAPFGNVPPARQQVDGNVQAFQAHGQLIEIWNSEMLPADHVDWFAKDSAPTIADGKYSWPPFRHQTARMAIASETPLGISWSTVQSKNYERR